MTWLAEPLLVTRRVALLLGLVVGLSISAAIIIATNTVGDLRTERERAIHAETFTKGEIVRLVHRVAKLERPSALELDYRIRVGLKRCLRSQACLRVFRRVAKVVKQGGRFVIVGPPGSAPASGPGSAPGGSRPPFGQPPSPGPRPSPGRPPGRQPSPSPAPRPPSPSRPNVTAPLPVQVCTMLIGVNCP